ncbi:MAG TPA: TatD family hydrolase, partial [Dehalococcoidia bacterium]|nr:TatD family hydrolase [Dehalococcoidia bacterium]
MIELVDTHAHLQEPEFARDVDEVIERAVAAGIVAIIVPAADVESAKQGVSLARRFDGVFATAGYHPHEAARLDAAALDAI